MLVFPETPLEPNCAVLFIPVELIPIVGALLGRLEARHEWSSYEDWEKGYRAFVKLQDQLMSSCVDTIVQEIRAVRGVKPDYASVPIDERTTDMYRDFNDLIGHLNTIIFALRGLEDPDDSILQALRGDIAADASRNVVDLLT